MPGRTSNDPLEAAFVVIFGPGRRSSAVAHQARSDAPSHLFARCLRLRASLERGMHLPDAAVARRVEEQTQLCDLRATLVSGGSEQGHATYGLSAGSDAGSGFGLLVCARDDVGWRFSVLADVGMLVPPLPDPPCGCCRSR